MRSLTAATRQAMMASETGEVFLYLLMLTHKDAAGLDDMDPMYFVNNTVDIISNGHTYMAFPFDLNIPDDREDEITRIQLAIDNVDLRVVTAVRGIDTPAVFTLSIIRAAEPDVLIAGPFACTLRNVSYDALVVSGDLSPFENVSDEAFPQHGITPAYFPGLFG